MSNSSKTGKTSRGVFGRIFRRANKDKTAKNVVNSAVKRSKEDDSQHINSIPAALKAQKAQLREASKGEVVAVASDLILPLAEGRVPACLTGERGKGIPLIKDDDVKKADGKKGGEKEVISLPLAKEVISLPLAKEKVVDGKASKCISTNGMIQLPKPPRLGVSSRMATAAGNELKRRTTTTMPAALKVPSVSSEGRIPSGLVRERAQDFEKRINAIQEEQANRNRIRSEARARFFLKDVPPAGPLPISSSSESNATRVMTPSGGSSSSISRHNQQKVVYSSTARKGRSNHLLGSDFLIDDEIMDQPDLTISSLVKRTRDTLISLDGGESVSEIAQETYGILKELQPFESYLIPTKFNNNNHNNINNNLKESQVPSGRRNEVNSGPFLKDKWRRNDFGRSYVPPGTERCRCCLPPHQLNQDILSIKTYLLRLKRLLIENSSGRLPEMESSSSSKDLLILEPSPHPLDTPAIPFKTQTQTLRERIYCLEQQIMEKDETIRQLRGILAADTQGSRASSDVKHHHKLPLKDK
eukprot:TRINITY_DN6203_c0_g1_i1.p1 TRINITY_DN6203_c0_g1~~TRINITY_DN6203_c0_g1_i1.p1  ORF type:complete len:529 (-),score=157.37 TRINITY_DN6203_c0_g1_i1:242-1828(-)